MDKGILIEYADMKEEIKDLRRRIEKSRKNWINCMDKLLWIRYHVVRRARSHLAR